ncbi:hypothetical protein F5148DRAFT_1205887 [Russula earlei]|uniref:Uncharacterized protein n=1 Tax=Russula earlei TaxID=71964 RepID=A0ACC0U898_9AGAM|nr:hypothetical protein F5148DRAFT_1205887 [Russula earlei]
MTTRTTRTTMTMTMTTMTTMAGAGAAADILSRCVVDDHRGPCTMSMTAMAIAAESAVVSMARRRPRRRRPDTNL